MAIPHPIASFHPRNFHDTMYKICVSCITRTNATITTIDTDIMHKWFGHPSSEALSKAQKHTHNFPDINPTKSIAPCLRCTLWKMLNESFPDNTKQASLPFKLIHLDLNSFLKGSYQKYWYMIVFFDDFTSFAWTVIMQSKNSTLQATKDFLQMVKNQYNTFVKGWMSNVGGEYKSGAFDWLLVDNGIHVFQSTLHTPQ